MIAKDKEGLPYIVEHFLKTCTAAKTAMAFLPEKIKKCELKTIDYLHDIELYNLTYHKLGKLQQKEVLNLKQRREYKNEYQILEPLVKFLESPEGKTAIKRLEQVLGELRKVEKYHYTRVYKRRVEEGD